jgi:hypothetical protein
MATEKEQRIIEVIANGKKTEATMTQITNAIKVLNSEVRKLPVNSAEARAKMAELAKLNTRFRDLSGEMRGLNKSTGSFWNQMKAGMFGVLGGNLLTNFIGAMNTLTFGVLRGSAKLEDLRADVRKVTNLSEQDLAKLEQKFGELDTRTARSELLGLATAAGKMGTEGVEDINEFVNAANQIKVALGEDLGEDAILHIAKINELFGQTKALGIEKSMLATGSAINTLEQRSSAAAPFIVGFTKQIAGAAVNAGMLEDQTLGLAATLDILGQREETSATALQQLFVKMFTDTAYWANVAGMEVGKYSSLLETDFNAALMATLQGLNGNSNSLGDFAKQLDGANMDGQRAVGVLSALAEHTEILATQQNIANQAFTEATSVSEEYKIKNANLAAELDKLDKKWEAMKNSTGAKDFMISMVAALSAFLDLLKAVGPYFLALIKLVTVGTVAWASYKLVVLASTLVSGAFIATLKAKTWFMNLERIALTAAALAQALFTGNVAKAAVAMNYFNKVVKFSPIGIIFGVITAAATAWALFSSNTKEAAENTKEASSAMTEMEEVNKAAAESMKETTASVKKSFDELKRTNTGTAERTKILNDLNSKYGLHLKDLQDEAAFLRDVAAAERDVIDNLLLQARATAIKSKLNDLAGQEIQYRMKLEELSKKPYSTYAQFQRDQEAYENTRYALSQVIDKQQEYLDMGKKLEEEGSKRKKTGGGPIKSKEQIEKEAREHDQAMKKAFDDDIKAEQARHNQRLTELTVQAMEKKQFGDAYDKGIEDAEIAHLQKILEIEKKHGKDVTETQLSIAKAQFKIAKESAEKIMQTLKSTLDISGSAYEDTAIPAIAKLLEEEDKLRNEHDNIVERWQDNKNDRQRQKQLQKLELEKEADLKNKYLTEEEILRIEQNFQKLKDQLRAEALQKDLQRTQQYINAAEDIYSRGVSIMNQLQENELTKFRNGQFQKEKGLKERLENGYISEKQYQQQIEALNEETRLKEAEHNRAKFEREKHQAAIRATIGAFEAYVSALKYDPTTILSTVLLGLGLAQAVAIEAQPTPEFATGGRTMVQGESGQRYNADIYGSNWSGGRVNSTGYIAGERGSELVVPNWLVTHPRFLNIAGIIDTAIATRQFGSGGFTGNVGGNQGSTDPAIHAMLQANAAAIDKLTTRLDEPFYGLAYFDKNKYDRKVANQEVVREMSRIG